VSTSWVHSELDCTSDYVEPRSRPDGKHPDRVFALNAVTCQLCCADGHTARDCPGLPTSSLSSMTQADSFAPETVEPLQFLNDNFGAPTFRADAGSDSSISALGTTPPPPAEKPTIPRRKKILVKKRKKGPAPARAAEAKRSAGPKSKRAVKKKRRIQRSAEPKVDSDEEFLDNLFEGFNNKRTDKYLFPELTNISNRIVGSHSFIKDGSPLGKNPSPPEFISPVAGSLSIKIRTPLENFTS
jgi:hypothetical protein